MKGVWDLSALFLQLFYQSEISSKKFKEINYGSRCTID